jgi:hypothetical protein
VHRWTSMFLLQLCGCNRLLLRLWCSFLN